MFKKMLAIFICLFVLQSAAVAVYADETPDGAPVDGNFVYDPAYAAEIAEKEAAAMANDGIATFSNTVPNVRLKSGSFAANSNNVRLAIYQEPQERNYWCGYAAMKSLLDFEGINKTQLQIAQETYDEDSALAWYTIDGSDHSQFPAAVKLKELTGFNYVPYPYGAAGGTNIQASNIDYKIKSTINQGHGVLICGRSYGNIPGHASILPGYPASEIGHWIASDGYKDDAASIWIVDPARSDVISWSNNISAYYEVTATKLAAFAKARGIIW